MTSPASNQAAYSLRQKIGLLAGVPVFLIMLILPRPAELSPEGYKTLAVAVLMALWWITEAIPIPATSLIPLILFPFLGVMTYKEVAPNYGDNIIFLFMGGFFLAVTMQKWNLHKRLALHVVRLIGATPQRLILGFMTATAFISMMISNTSTTLLMFPIALAVIVHLSEQNDEGRDVLPEKSKTNFQVALMLGIAYAASVGGLGTIIGTPPNVIFVGAVSTLYPEAPRIEFFQWIKIGIPLVAVFIPIIWLLLTKLIFPMTGVELKGAKDYIREQLQVLGRMHKGERLTLFVFSVTAIALVFQRNIDLEMLVIPGWADRLGISSRVSDTTVIMSAALLLFTVPVNWRKGEFLLDWKSAVKIPWGILLLFGGGIALAKGFQTTGLAVWFGSNLTYLSRIPIVVVVLLICLLLTFLTEVTSNTATTNIFMPILASTAMALQTHPLLLMIPATISASCAFMLPVATPPNAIIFGTGYVSISDMAKAGILINLIGALLVTIAVYVLAIPIFDIDPNSMPSWVP